MSEAGWWKFASINLVTSWGRVWGEPPITTELEVAQNHIRRSTRPFLSQTQHKRKRSEHDTIHKGG